MSKEKPYHYISHSHSRETIANVPEVNSCDFENKKISKNTSTCISREHLENRLEDSVKNDDWEIFMDVLAL